METLGSYSQNHYQENMTTPLTKYSQIGQCLMAIFMPFVMLCVCAGTAFYSRDNPSGAVATIPKAKIKATASREEIAEELVNAWMRKYQIGTLGWTDWIWKYEIEKVEFWGSTSECVSIRFKVLTVLPSGMTGWVGLYTKQEGRWIKEGYTMTLVERDNYYELRGPFSLC